MAKILNKIQEQTLQSLASTGLAKQFYFSGGTALAHFYLKHRLSEDLDFFSEEEFDAQSVYVTIQSLKSSLKFREIDYQSSFNRNLFFLRFNSKRPLKLEFTYYPFKQVEQPVKKEGLLVDSLIDIAVNKLFTIAQQPRGRDYFDLYSIIKHESYSIDQLRMLAKQKFDWHVDPLQLASRLHEVGLHIDDPILVHKMDKKAIQSYFESAALSFKDQILKK
jgi:predicted nucleotidyltransferase component of viral defense system